MPNTILKPSVIVAQALGLLQRELVLARTVWTNAQGNSTLGAGDTFSIRVPGQLAARRRKLRGTGDERTIVDDTITETKVDVTLTEDIYSSVPITDEELTLDITDFGVQILQPQTRAVAEGVENDLADLMAGAPFADGPIILDPTVGMYVGLLDARQALNDANVPQANRFCVVGSGLEKALLADPEFHQADKSGSTDALNDAIIGTKAGFTFLLTNSPGVGKDEGYAYHQTAFVQASRAPIVPQGAAFGQSQAYMGQSMRWLKDYDYRNVQDRSLVDTFAGYAFVPDTVNGATSFVRAVKLELTTASITVAPTSKTFAVGATQQLGVNDAKGKAVPGGSVAWVSSDPTKATVSSTGRVTAVAAGTTTITATYQNRTATSAFTVTDS